MLSSTASTAEKNQPVVKILVLSNKDGLLSENIQSQLELIKKKSNCQIDIITESENEEKTAEKIQAKIKQGNGDLVLVDKNITQSAWQIIEICSKPKSRKPHQKSHGPRFYLDGTVEDIVDNEIHNTKFSGAIGIVKDGKTIMRRSYGNANQSEQHEVKNSPNTKVVIASITKIFTAVAIAKLIEDSNGKLNYDDSISQFLPESFPNKQYFLDKKITIRELLLHTSGLGQFQAETFFKEKILDFKSINDYSPMLEGPEAKIIFEPDADPRNKFRYSNINYLMLGHVIQAVSGKDYYQYIQEDVLPSNMKDTVPIRGGDQSFALSYAPTPKPIAVPKWMEQGVDKEKNPALQKIVDAANDLLDQYKQIMDSIIPLYQNRLANVKNADDLSKFKSEFKEHLKKAFEIFSSIKVEISNSLEELQNINDDSSDTKEKIIQLRNLLSDLSINLTDSSPASAPNLLYSLIIDLSIAVPAGYFRSTADDLLIFQEALWKGEIIKKPEALITEKIELPAGTISHYSYGVCIWKTGSAMEAIGHDGCAPGAFSTLRTYRNAGISIASVSNVENNNVFTPVNLIEKNLLASCLQESNIRYFDPDINPQASQLLVMDIDQISNNKLRSTQMSSQTKIFQKLDTDGELKYNMMIRKGLKSTLPQQNEAIVDQQKTQQKSWQPTVDSIPEDEKSENNQPPRKTF